MESRNTIIVSILFTVALSACGMAAPEPTPTATIAPTDTVVPTSEPTITTKPTVYPNPADWDLSRLGAEDWNMVEVQEIELADWQAEKVLSDLKLYWDAFIDNTDGFPDCETAYELASPRNPDFREGILTICPGYIELGEYYSDPPLLSLRTFFFYDAGDQVIIVALDTNGQTWQRPVYYSDSQGYKASTEVEPATWYMYLLFDPGLGIWRVFDSYVEFQE